MQILSYIGGANLGLGFHSATLNVHSAAFDDVTPIRNVPTGGGQDVEFAADMLSSTASLSRQLNVSASASLKYGIVGGGTAKSKFLSTFKQNSFSTYVYVYVRVVNEQQNLDLSRIKFKDRAATYFSNKPGEFTDQYGDSFVSAVTTGGEFIGLIEIESFSAEASQSIKASLSGKVGVGLFSANAKAEFEKALSSIQSEYKMTARIWRTGGTGDLPKVNPEDVLNEALKFPTQVRSAGSPFEMLVMFYKQIEHPDGPGPLDVVEQVRILTEIGELREKFIKCQDDLEYALEHQKQFSGIDAGKVNDQAQKVASQISELVNSARACYADRTKCLIPSALDRSLLDTSIILQTGGNMISGHVAKAYWETGNPLETGEPFGPRSDEIHVEFPAGKFQAKPTVQVSLFQFDTGTAINARLAVQPVNVTTQGFDIRVSTWADSRVYGVGVSWFAHV